MTAVDYEGIRNETESLINKILKNRKPVKIKMTE